MDLWTHGCLHKNHANILGETAFLIQASRCVQTRDVNPTHTIKNLAIFKCVVGSETAIFRVHRTAGILVENEEPGESILVETPSQLANAVLLRLNTISPELPCEITWSVHARSRGSTPEKCLYTIVGSMNTYVSMYVKSMIAAT